MGDINFADEITRGVTWIQWGPTKWFDGWPNNLEEAWGDAVGSTRSKQTFPIIRKRKFLIQKVTNL